MENEIKYPGLWAKCLTDVNPWPVKPVQNCPELSVGEMYHVEYVDMDRWKTDIFLTGFSGKHYNSVQFEFYLDDKVHNIYKDPTYNHFIEKFGSISLFSR